MATTTQPIHDSRTTRARELCAPRGGQARSAEGRRSSFPTSPPARAPANALSRYRRKVSNHPLLACDDPAGWRRGARMNLRALAAADPDTPQRQRNCGAVPVGSQVEIRIKDGSAYYSGLETCGNVWLCPVCSAKIHHRRAAELRDALTTWEAQGHAASLVTITIPHDLGDGLSKLVDVQRDAWKHVTQGAAWQRLRRKLGIAGHIIALEFTWGDDNGWHPHYHVLLIHDQDLDAAAIAQLHGHIHVRLAASLPRTRPSRAGPAARRPHRPERLRHRCRCLHGQDRRVDACRRNGPRRPQDQPNRQPHTVPDPGRLLPDRRLPRPGPVARIRPRRPQPRGRPLVPRSAASMRRLAPAAAHQHTDEEMASLDVRR